MAWTFSISHVDQIFYPILPTLCPVTLHVYFCFQKGRALSGNPIRMTVKWSHSVLWTLCDPYQAPPSMGFCIDQSYGLCGRGRGWGDLGEWHWNMYNIMYATSRQSRFDARYWMLGAGALGGPSGRVWGGRREEGSGWGTQVYLWQIHFNIWQN